MQYVLHDRKSDTERYCSIILELYVQYTQNNLADKTKNIERYLRIYVLSRNVYLVEFWFYLLTSDEKIAT